jgi:hypothetical protein
LIKYETKPLDDAIANRATYVANGLTILRAYRNAGLPNRPSPLGSFEQWSDWVRGAIIWLGLADPCETMERIRHNDPSRALLRTLLMRWGESTVATTTVTASQLIQAACEAASGDFFISLREIAPDGQGISAVRLRKMAWQVQGSLD